MRPSREVHTPDLQPRPSATSSLAQLSLPVKKTSSGVQSSATWTSTSGDLGSLSDTDEIRERSDFVEEYNRIAKKHGIRPLVPDNPDHVEVSGVLQKRGWWSRTFRRTSSQSTEHSLRRQRSSSHVMSHLAHPKKDSLKDQDLQGLVRLCGKSFLYMPPEYAPGSLVLPTCFRATAQYLVQHAPETRGVFRIPGSIRVVNELYEFYCAEQCAHVASTVRSPNLPAHINAGIHDVASCFKKFLSGLPGGILGSLSLFDAMIAINSQLYGDPEFSRTKKSKIRARLIALAIGTLRSQFRRELICAVFGLLCLLGRAAETAPREDALGRPLPTSDLMGYNALGIVFGPLLVGDMLGSYTVKLADPSSGLFIVPRSPSSSKSQKGKKKAKEVTEDHIQPPFLDVDKIHVANNITEMLVTNWRDVVRQMRSLDTTMGALRSHSQSRSSMSNSRLRRSSSVGRSSGSDSMVGDLAEGYVDSRPRSSEHYTKNDSRPSGRYIEDRHTRIGRPGNRAVSFRQIDSNNDALSVRKTRPASTRNELSTRPGSGHLGALSPQTEESAGEEDVHPAMRSSTPLKSSLKSSNSKPLPDMRKRRDPISDENTSSESNQASAPPPLRSPSRVASGISPIKKHFESLEAQPRKRVPSPNYTSDTHQLDYSQPRPPATPSSTRTSRPEHDQSHHRDAPASKEISDTGNGKPRPKSDPSLSETLRTDDIEPAYRAKPSRRETYKSGHGHTRPRSTLTSVKTPEPRTEHRLEHMGSQRSHRGASASPPKGDLRSMASRAMNQVDGSPERDPQQPLPFSNLMKAYQIGQGVKILKAPSTMRSQPKMFHVDPPIVEPIPKPSFGSNPGQEAINQMDGAVDFIVPVPSSHSSVNDLRGEFEGRTSRDCVTPSFPPLKSRSHPRAVLTKKKGMERQSSWASPRKSSPKMNLTGKLGGRPGANKVLGLAAIFDTAAQASPFVPTPGGSIQRKRRETAGVISPYTSNPSPRASLQSVTSVSTPVSLMSPTRLSIHISTPAPVSGKKSMIPRPRDASANHKAVRTERYMSPTSLPRRDASQFSTKSSYIPSRLSTPSRLPVKKNVSTNESPSLPQFDGLSGTGKSLLRLTAQQEIRPVGFYSSPIPQVNGGYKSLPRLSQQSTSSRHSDETSLTRDSTAPHLNLNQVCSASSLRDQIRSLRVEMSAKNEDCSQLRLDLEELRKTKEVSEILLREDLERAKSDTQKWRRRAEKAEKKIDKYERLAVQMKEARDHELRRDEYCADEYSFISGSDHLTTDRAASQPLTARSNQSVRRTLPMCSNGASSLGAGDGFSECSGSTVVRTAVATDENGPVGGTGLWRAVDELVDFAFPALLEENV